MKKQILRTIGVGVLAVTAGLGQTVSRHAVVASSANNNPAPVVVTNTTTNPVPTTVTGTVNANLTNAVVPVSGTVSLASGGTVQVGNSASSPVPVQTVGPSAVTHVGQLASQSVVVNFDFSTFAYDRITADGQRTSNFNVPTGKVFVLTDLDWSATGPSGSTVQVQLLGCTSTPSVFVDSSAPTTADGTVGRSEHMTSGIVLTQLPCGFSNSASSTVHELVLRGYLAPNL